MAVAQAEDEFLTNEHEEEPFKESFTVLRPVLK